MGAIRSTMSKFSRGFAILSGLAALVILVGVLFLIRDIKANMVKPPVKVVVAGQCSLSVPADVFNNLATPWQLQPPCKEADPNAAVFVQAVIFDRGTGTLSVYSPLVVDAGTQPAIAPVTPVLPINRVVGIFGGGNDVTTTLIGPGAGQCTNGIAGHPFGQVFFCNTRGFFDAVNASGILFPPIGVERSGLPCPTVRDFRIVDQDQSDNVTTTYLVNATGQTAQNTAANRVALAAGGFTIQKNGSDNRLLDVFVDPAVGCTPWKIPDLADPGAILPTQATNELQAAAFQGAPTALIPAGDPMAGPNILSLVNLYRQSVDQPRAATLADANVVDYCENMAENAPSWITGHAADFGGLSPTVGMTLEAFLLDRNAAARVVLGCSK